MGKDGRSFSQDMAAQGWTKLKPLLSPPLPQPEAGSTRFKSTTFSPQDLEQVFHFLHSYSTDADKTLGTVPGPQRGPQRMLAVISYYYYLGGDWRWLHWGLNNPHVLLLCSVLTEWNLPEAESGGTTISLNWKNLGHTVGNLGNQLQRIGVGAPACLIPTTSW